MTVHKSRSRAVAHQLFSTKSFVPGHVVGAAILAFGTIAVTKAFLAAARDKQRAPSAPGADLMHVPPHASNERGHYGKGS